MNKKLRLFLSAMPVIALPVVAASCNTTNNKNDFSSLKEKIEKLSVEQKRELIDNLNLTKEEKSELIDKLNSGAGIAAAIVWYVTSAEQRAAAMQAYTLAKIAFDNIKKKEEKLQELDYTKSKDGVVKNTEGDKAVPVVFMDIDETVFVNEYTESWMVYENNGVFSEEFKGEVDAKGNRKPVPGAIDFINHVFKNGGIVMFNSGIPQVKAPIEGIKKNLIKHGVKEKYVHDWMFWCSGVDTTAKGGKYEDKSPWKTALEKANIYKRVTSKNQRMNDVSDNKDGWNFKASDEKSGDKIRTKVIMKIGDDFNDFYDDAYKHLKPGDNIKFIEEHKLDRLFTDIEFKNGKGVKVTVKDGQTKVEELNWHQFNIQVPGNAMYGGWARPYKHGKFDEIWKALEKVFKNSQDNIQA